MSKHIYTFRALVKLFLFVRENDTGWSFLTTNCFKLEQCNLLIEWNQKIFSKANWLQRDNLLVKYGSTSLVVYVYFYNSINVFNNK